MPDAETQQLQVRRRPPRSTTTSTGGPKHPSDDLMTELLEAEFDDDDGHRPQPHPRGGARLRQPPRRRRQRDHHPAHRMDGQGPRRAPRPAPRARRGPRPSSPTPSRSCSATRPPPPSTPATSPRTSSTTADVVPEGSIMLLLNGSANRDDRKFPDGDTLRHPPQDRPPPGLRLRHPLLPRRRARPPRRAGRPRRGAATLPHLGSRLGQRRAGQDLHRPRLGTTPRDHALSHQRPVVGGSPASRPYRPKSMSRDGGRTRVRLRDARAHVAGVGDQRDPVDGRRRIAAEEDEGVRLLERGRGAVPTSSR